MISNFNLFLFQIFNQAAGQNKALDFLIIFLAKYLIFIIIIFLAFFWLARPQYRSLIFLSFCSAVLGVVFNFFIGQIYYHPRPFVALSYAKTLLTHSADASFPSDHTTFLLSLALIFVYNKKIFHLGLVLFGVGLLVGLARVISGLHWPFDIVGSAVVSLLASVLVWQNKKQIEKISAKFL